MTIGRCWRGILSQWKQKFCLQFSWPKTTWTFQMVSEWTKNFDSIFWFLLINRRRVHVNIRCSGHERKRQLQEKGRNHHDSSERIHPRLHRDGKVHLHPSMDDSAVHRPVNATHVFLRDSQLRQLQRLHDQLAISIGHQSTLQMIRGCPFKQSIVQSTWTWTVKRRREKYF